MTLSDSAGSYSAAGLTVSVDNDQAKGDKESNLEIKELFTPAPSSPPHSAEQKGELADPGSIILRARGLTHRLDATHSCKAVLGASLSQITPAICPLTGASPHCFS